MNFLKDQHKTHENLGKIYGVLAYPQRPVPGASRTFESPPVGSLLQHSISTAGCSRFGSWPEDHMRTPHRKPRRTYLPASPEFRGSCSASIFPILSAALKGGGWGGNDSLRLAVPKRERLGPVHARGPRTHLRGGAFPTTRAVPPHPLQRLGVPRGPGASPAQQSRRWRSTPPARGRTARRRPRPGSPRPGFPYRPA